MKRIKASEKDALKLELLKKQKGRCPLCGYRMRDLTDACLDHDHKTGDCRDVVCRNCNAMEGKIFNCANRAKRDKTALEWINNLVDYWNRHLLEPSGIKHHTHRTAEEKRIKANKKASKRRKAKKRELDLSG